MRFDARTHKPRYAFFSPDTLPPRRNFTACNRPNGGRPNPLPQLTIKGRSLKPLGFTTGQRIEVLTGPGQLIIRLASGGNWLSHK
ncbi:SymE family type I addiction module toxin [Brenneria goodwinii]|uniref:SymE family type I addiction module toxin n=1 Tax=Brenneria goodwinii TaxID=1109412 RepID=UPI000EF28CB4|nr:SymE family type I addiction module toxin [Brenneria goodwinii]MCG8159756.1 SymE family type I addiction module toxin [Brenneria goodwinii]MCG8165846.1 SymE family type I addiction module toxin [Brenneria goodwinii]MCG8170193.1 SymE family type I addiction module toxin [Brenneria goodwinii]MCG8173615.1 SymE family type I addiction module toxin [Brenneria goodwinii]